MTISEEDALRHAVAIKAFWAAQGFDVKAAVVRDVVAGHAVFSIKTDMVNGCPRRRLKKSAA